MLGYDLTKYFTERMEKQHFKPEESLIAEVLPLETHRSILIYGQTKTGKTRLAAWEAAGIAKALGPGVSVVFFEVEPNVKPQEMADVVAACAYHMVPCEIFIVFSAKALDKIVEKVVREVEKLAKKTGTYIRSVYVIDSITGLVNAATEYLSFEVGSSGSSTLIPYANPILVRIVNPVRRVVNKTGTYLLMTAHAMSLRGDKYMGIVPEKPRFANVVRYYDDAEIYLSETLLDTRFSPKNSGLKPHTRQMVTVVARNAPEYVKKSVSYIWLREGMEEVNSGGIRVKKKPEPLIVNGKLEEYDEGTYTKIIFDPQAKAGELKFFVLKPVKVSGPKYL